MPIDFTDMPSVNQQFMNHGYAMCNDFKNYGYEMCNDFKNYGYEMCNDFKNYRYGICKTSNLRHFSLFTDMESVNQAPYATFLFLQTLNM